MEDCINCGMSLRGGALTLPWEDDDTPMPTSSVRIAGVKTQSMVTERMMINI